jgi:hypothetical protein
MGNSLICICLAIFSRLGIRLSRKSEMDRQTKKLVLINSGGTSGTAPWPGAAAAFLALGGGKPEQRVAAKHSIQ